MILLSQHTSIRRKAKRIVMKGEKAFEARNWDQLYAAANGGLLLFQEHGFFFEPDLIARFRTWAALALLGKGKGQEAAKLISEGWDSPIEKAYQKPYLCLFLFCACQDESLRDKFREYSDLLADLLLYDPCESLVDAESYLFLVSYYLVQEENEKAYQFLKRYKLQALIQAYPHLEKRAQCLTVLVDAKRGDLNGIVGYLETLKRKESYQSETIRYFRKQLNAWKKGSISTETIRNERIDFDRIWRIWSMP